MTEKKQKILHDLQKLNLPEAEIITDPNRLKAEARSVNLWPPDEDLDVIALVAPSKRQEVQRLIALANRLQFPVWTISQGRNWGYGSKRPLVSGCVILSLENLNRIIEINTELAYAVIEPGVTYRQLRSHLETHHPDLWSDCTDGPPDGSVIGNALDRGLGVTHLGDHFGSLCGMEILTAQGDVIRTGGGPPNCHTWNTHKWGVGPYLEGLFTQSNFGIVLSAGIWLLRKPECFESFVFDLKDEKNLGLMVDRLRELLLAGIITSFTHIVNDLTTLAVISRFPKKQLNQMNRRSDQLLQDLKDELGVPSWSFGGGLLGEKDQVRFAKRKLKKALKGLGRLEFVDDRKIKAVEFFRKMLANRNFLVRLSGWVLFWLLRKQGLTEDKIEAAPHIHSVLKGVPSDYFVRHAYLKSRLPKPEEAHPEKDEVGMIWCAPVLPMTGSHLEKVTAHNRKLFEDAGFEFYAALLVQNARSLICLHGIFFDPKIPQEVLKAQELYRNIQSSMNELGYQEYRVPLLGMKSLFQRSPPYSKVLSQIKAALDPQGVLSPDKYGIQTVDRPVDCQ